MATGHRPSLTDHMSLCLCSNGNAHLEEVPEPEPLDEPVDVPEEEPAVPEMDSPAAPAPATTESADLAFEPEKEKSPEPAETREASVQEDGETEEPTAQEVAQPAKTCSWAAVIASKATAPSAPPAAPKMAPAPVAAASKPADAANPQPQRTQRPPRNDRPPRENARPMSNTDFSAEDSRRPRFPDSHQLFVGNLPHSITEKELKAYFESEFLPFAAIAVTLPGLTIVLCIWQPMEMSWR